MKLHSLLPALLALAGGCSDGGTASGDGSAGTAGTAGAGGAGMGGASGGGGGEPPVPAFNQPSGLPTDSVTASDLFQVVGQIQAPVPLLSKHGMPHMVDGHLLVASPIDLKVFDITDPSSPAEVATAEHSMLVEHYTIGFSPDGSRTLAYLSHSTGAMVWDFSDVTAPVVVAEIATTGSGAAEYANRSEAVGVQAPLLFVPATLNGIVAVDSSDPSNPSEIGSVTATEVGLQNTGYAFVVGNMLYTSCHSCAGVATVDVSDPGNPQPLGALTDMATFGYGLTFNGGNLYVATKGESGSVGVQIVDVSDPGNPTLGRKHDAGAPHSGDGGYAAIQDGSLHFGASGLGYYKFDLSDGSVLGTIDLASVAGGVDQDFAMGFGHVGIIGDDDAALTSLFYHQATPDTSAPEVNFVSPADNASGQAVTTRIGITCTDWIDFRSLDPATFIVRPAGGDGIPGTLSTQSGIVNFTPESPLQPDTTYEIVIRSLRDHAGNASARFESSFSTGG